MSEKESDKELKRQYKIKTGTNTKFECRGALMHGPDRYYFWGALTLLIGTGLLYWGLVVPMLILQEIFPRWYNVVNVILFGILWIFTICMHFTVAYMDPGIVPRLPKKKFVSTGDPYLDSLNTPPTTKQVVVNGKSITCKLCSTCNIYRPPRTVHCSTCDNCVLRFDHHCPYIGNCVGLRNYKYFLYFLFGVLLSCLFALAHIIAFVANRVIARGWNGAFFAAPVNFVFAFIVAILCIISIGLISVLLVWTCYLVSLGRTTYEKIKFEKLLTPNPYDKGIVRNWINMCCAPNYPRAFYPRRHVPIPEVEEV